MQILLIIVTALALAAAGVALWRMQAAQLASRMVQGEKDSLTKSLETAETERKALADRLMASERECSRLTALLETAREEKIKGDELLKTQFANLAAEIMRRNSADFKADSEERLQQILNPLKTNIEEFRRAVTEAYSTEARERFSLEKAIGRLADVNQVISREARELTQALKGNNSVQGDWGEMVLETILEKSGLIKDEEYFIQATTDIDGKTMTKDDGGVLRPDVVVKYPDGRCVVIDSKVSLTAFLELSNASDESERHNAAQRHLQSVKGHIDRLSKKRYQEFIGSDQLDFVMMFIPNEPAYMAAMRVDPGLWQYAYDRNVLVVSPTHLVSGLRLIAQLWSRDKVTKNAIKIAEEAGKMYDKFADFVTDMDKIDKAINGAAKAHSDAMNKLQAGRGNLMKRASDLKAMGIKASKQLAQANDDADA